MKKWKREVATKGRYDDFYMLQWNNSTDVCACE